MSKQTFSIFQIFALYFPFCMRPYDARSSVTLEKLGFVVREPQSHLELTYFLPKISAFMLISGNWANLYLCVPKARRSRYFDSSIVPLVLYFD